MFACQQVRAPTDGSGEAEKGAVTLKAPSTGGVGVGWTSSFTISLHVTTHVVTVSQDDGAEIRFNELGTAVNQIDADSCKTSTTAAGGDYPDPQKYTLSTSTIAFCGARRLDAQLGYFGSTATYELVTQGGSTVEIFNSSGQLEYRGDLESPRAIAYAYTAKPATHTLCPDDGEAQCEAETDQPSGRRAVALVNGAGMFSELVDPSGIEYPLGHTTTNHRLTGAGFETAGTTTYGYSTTSKGLQDELTSVTSAQGEKTSISYTAGMVHAVTDPMANTTTYSYTDTTCATSTKCVTGT